MEKIFKTYESLGHVYFDAVFNNDLYKKGKEDLYYALKHFISGYAFERQGAPKRYKTAAICTLKDIRKLRKCNNIYKLGYNIYIKKLSKLNVKDNKNLNIFNENNSVLSLLYNENLNNKIDTLHMNSAADVCKAYNKIVFVRGVSTKIASFYLRDIVFLNKIEIDQIPPHFVQPVDVWVRRCSRILMKVDSSIDLKENNPSDKKFSHFIIDKSNEFSVHPSLVNAGMWLYGSKMTESCLNIEECFSNHDIISKKYEEYSELINGMNNALKFVSRDIYL